MLVPDSKAWNDQFSVGTQWAVVHVSPSASQQLFRLVSSELTVEETHTIEGICLQSAIAAITQATCLVLAPGLHEVTSLIIDCGYPLVIKGSLDEVEEEPSVFLSSLNKTAPILQIRSPHGVVLESVAFLNDSLRGCVEVIGPAKFTDCSFRALSRANNVSAVSIKAHATLSGCSFYRGPVGVTVNDKADHIHFHEGEAPHETIVQMEDCTFKGAQLVDGIETYGYASLKLSNISVEDIGGTALLASGRTTGYLKDSLISNTQGTGLVIECLSAIWIKQCTIEKCSGTSLPTSRNQTVELDNQSRVGGIIVRGKATPTIIGNVINENYLIRGRVAGLSVGVYVWPMSRCQILLCDENAARVSQNKIYGIELSDNDVDHAFNDSTTSTEGMRSELFAQPSATLLAVVGDCSPYVDNNTFSCNSSDERAIVVGGLASANISHNLIYKSAPFITDEGMQATSGRYGIRLGPNHRCDLSNNIFKLKGPGSETMDATTSVSCNFESEANLFKDYVSAPKMIAPKDLSSLLPNRIAPRLESSRDLKPRPVTAQLPTTPKRPVAPSQLRSSGPRRPHTAPKPVASRLSPRKDPLLRSGSSQNTNVSSERCKSPEEYEREVKRLNAIISQLNVRLRMKTVPMKQKDDSPRRPSSASTGRSASAEPFGEEVRVGKYVWDYSKMKDFNNSLVPLKDIRRSASSEDHSVDGRVYYESIPKRLHDDWLNAHKLSKDRSLAASMGDEIPPQKLSARQQGDLTYRMHDESCQHQAETRQRVRQQLIREEQAGRFSPTLARGHRDRNIFGEVCPLSEDELVACNQRVYYQQVKDHKELLEVLKKRFDYYDNGQGDETSPKGASKKSPPKYKPKKVTRNKSQLEAYAQSLYKGHKDAEAAQKASAVIYPKDKDSQPTKLIFVRKEKPFDVLYPPLHKQLIRSRADLEAYSNSLHLGRTDRPEMTDLSE